MSSEATTLERKESSAMTVHHPTRRSPFKSFQRDSTLQSFIIRSVCLLFIPQNGKIPVFWECRDTIKRKQFPPNGKAAGKVYAFGNDFEGDIVNLDE